MSERAELSPAQRALLAERLRGRSRTSHDRTFGTIPQAGDRRAPVSAEQEQILYQTYFLPGNPVYNEAVTIIKDGPLDVAALRLAFNQLVERHHIWRTTFRRVNRELTQVIGPAAEQELPLADLTELSDAEQETRVAELVTALATSPYDLRNGPLLRPLLVRFDADHHRLYLAMHHIIFDGVSLYRVVLPDLIALYEAAMAGRRVELPQPVQYGDYALWQGSGILDDELRRYLPYWREKLAAMPTLNLPLEKPRPSEQHFHGDSEWFAIPAAMVDRLRARGRSTGGTLFHVLAAAYALLLQQFTGDDDLVFATVADLRRRREFESMIGYCITPMPLRVRLRPDATFDELVVHVRGEMLDGLSHLVPFERLTEDLQPIQDAGVSPVFQAMIVLEPSMPSPHPQWSLQQLDPSIARDLEQAKTDFHMELDERPDGSLAGRFIFNTDVFNSDFGVRVTAQWLGLLERLAS
jgi:Condensation domain